jgi:sulfatase modifying factor 1
VISGSYVAVPGGTFVMGSDHHYVEERPAHPVAVEPFAIAAAPVTVAEFEAFVVATGHVTACEVTPLSGVPAGGGVFTPPDHPVDLSDPSGWWSWVAGTSWRHPLGPGSVAVDDHPVVQVSLADAEAYCAWAGVRLPTETEWEWAAAGASLPANVWSGDFPHAGVGATAPVGSFPPSPRGLVDAVGNVWEWTTSAWTSSHTACCGSAGGEDLRVVKGGSFLCSPDYCARYRPQARMAMDALSTTCHLGFRTAR